MFKAVFYSNNKSANSYPSCVLDVITSPNSSLTESTDRECSGHTLAREPNVDPVAKGNRAEVACRERQLKGSK